MGVYLRTKYSWKPGANTVAYRPLNSITTVNDQSGNGNDLMTTTANVTFGVNAGVDCVQIPTTYGYLRTSDVANFMPSGGADRTISLWLYNNTTQQQTVGYWFWYGSSAQDKTFSIRQSKGVGTTYYYKLYLYTDEVDTGVEIAVGERQNHIITYSNGAEKYYINGQLVASGNYTLNTTSSVFSIGTNYSGTNPDTNGKPNGCVSNFIVENIEWDADTIDEYFNSLKADYGIS